ncbi:hypothetical protein COCNU_05G001890 [Cocos nucifera]|uniref:Uncharacterized protein n=1 Tax=Cocos nucifera TaxID=13894 RepID=A0A8K0I904_COCNU|nr:hypothetical protein COCNU_05G001890 [Cocos nucifera]
MEHRRPSPARVTAGSERRHHQITVAAPSSAHAPSRRPDPHATARSGRATTAGSGSMHREEERRPCTISPAPLRMPPRRIGMWPSSDRHSIVGSAARTSPPLDRTSTRASSCWKGKIQPIFPASFASMVDSRCTCTPSNRPWKIASARVIARKWPPYARIGGRFVKLGLQA